MTPKVHIFLLSCTDNLNSELRAAMRRELAARGGRVAYISSAPQSGERRYYQSTVADYSAIYPEVVVDYVDLSEQFSNEALDALCSYNSIYLSGGNTYVFLDDARRRGLQTRLEKHLANGGLLIGASAGAIMLTPSIDLAGVLGGDKNTPQIIDTTGFGFLDFEFHPHYRGSSKEDAYLSAYAGQHNRTVYACKDGDGVLYTNENTQLFGGVVRVV